MIYMMFFHKHIIYNKIRFQKADSVANDSTESPTQR